MTEMTYRCRTEERDDIRALKTLLRDDLLRERNAFAREVMADIESQKVEQ